MSSFALNNNLYINVTPRGAYFAVQDNAIDVTRSVLLKLLQQEETPELSDDTVADICNLETDDAFNLLQRMQSLGLISGQKTIETAPEETLEDSLTELLSSLSDSNKVLLAELSGLYMGASGFPHEAAEELAAISANLSEVYQRHKGLLQGNLGFNQHAWGLIDAAGNSEVGFWPLYVGYNQFSLVIHGMPQLNRPAFKRLVWSLVKRYGKA
jgi:hypothetical protein